MKLILGIDPGLASTGYGLVRADGTSLSHVFHGVISTSSKQSTGERLKRLYEQLCDIIDHYSPHSAGVESLYFAKNITSAIPVAQARGVTLLALAQRNVVAEEYPPQAIKQAIVGQGRAEKAQVQELVRMLLGLQEIPGPDHAADALAAAICHFNTSAIDTRLGRTASDTVSDRPTRGER